MLKIDALGIGIIFTVHDELVCEVPAEEAETRYAQIIEIMSAPISWAPGLPLGADGFICDYYKKI